MAHKCKICHKIDNRSIWFGKNGWYHAKCVFEAWQEALKELDSYRKENKN